MKKILSGSCRGKMGRRSQVDEGSKTGVASSGEKLGSRLNRRFNSWGRTSIESPSFSVDAYTRTAHFISSVFIVPPSYSTRHIVSRKRSPIHWPPLSKSWAIETKIIQGEYKRKMGRRYIDSTSVKSQRKKKGETSVEGMYFLCSSVQWLQVASKARFNPFMYYYLYERRQGTMCQQWRYIHSLDCRRHLLLPLFVSL